ncbi:molecular chaperone [Actinotalea sp.]|uniref:TorD/DmsD family molecular chaperone n=1 Tax=Actinotalea sp. TaxID=1872145 RepID=UPI0035651D1E
MTARELAPTELAETLDSCAAAATFLSRVYLQAPDGPMLAELAGDGVLAQWPIQDDTLTTEGLAAIGRSVGEQPTPLTELHADHQRLFLGPENLLACPYESVYLNPEHLTFGSETLEVRRWYGRYGLAAPAVGREPDDHIGLELAFVAHLCLRALDVLEDGEATGTPDDAALQVAVRALAEFLGDHLLAWSEEFCDHVVGGARTDFYRGVGLLTRGLTRRMGRDLTA